MADYGELFWRSMPGMRIYDPWLDGPIHGLLHQPDRTSVRSESKSSVKPEWYRPYTALEQKSANCNNLVSVGEAKKGTSVTWWSVVPHLVPAVCNFLASTPSAFLNDDSASTNKPRCSSRPSSTAARLVLPRNMSKRLTTCSKACSYASKFWFWAHCLSTAQANRVALRFRMTLYTLSFRVRRCARVNSSQGGSTSVPLSLVAWKCIGGLAEKYSDWRSSRSWPNQCISRSNTARPARTKWVASPCVPDSSR